MNKSNVLVSIGMPVYNGESFICEALDSLLAQTFTNFELIISDNASTDATESICQRYAKQDSRIRYVRQQKNIGALENFQFVLDEASSEYFMWAAYDDKWDNDWIYLLLDALKKSNVGAAFGTLMHIDENSLPFRHLANGKTFEFCGLPLKRRISYYLEFERGGKANLVYSLFRKTVLKNLRLATYSFDYHIIFDLLLKTEIISVPSTKFYKRVHLVNAGGLLESKLRIIFRRLSYLFVPVDIGFIKGYFKHSSFVEWPLYFFALPIKFIFAYLFYLKIAAFKVKLKISKIL